MEGMIGEIRMFAGNFAPRTWAFCEGQLLPIDSNTALFSILGTIYGGDGRTTFALPDMRSRVPMGAGNGPGFSDRRLGAKGGVEEVALNVTQIPSHNHNVIVGATENDGNINEVNGHILANSTVDMYHTGNPENKVALAGVSVGNTGGSREHTNLQPFLAVNFIICLQGVFPSRS